MFPNWVQSLSQALGVVEGTIENRIFLAFFEHFLAQKWW
jgi:hypothetical protein